MRFVQHKACNRVLGAPPGWDQSAMTCNALPIADVDYGRDVGRAVMSFWRPSPEELAMLNAGGLVALSVFGMNGSMPPVAMTTVEP